MYHVLNRGNGRMRLFHKNGDFDAFQRVLIEGLQRYPVDLLTYCLMPNHWHLVVRPRSDEALSPWPVNRPNNWTALVNGGISQRQLVGLRQCVDRGRPWGPGDWVQATAARLGLTFTLRGPDRPRKKAQNQ